MQAIIKFFKPGRRKIILFLIIFWAMFYKLPFLHESFSGTSRSVFQVIKDYSGKREDLYFILVGVAIYIIASYFISCAAIRTWQDLRRKK